ncbi:neuroglobin, isoform CRA_b [Rattus norvegicus]|uniref:Neuroglobin, isoform CRA_b n=1 Tax=Rattus norvegicus TaxID=10116 RepID=A6JE79_RAT|nr:neuroglobin, isoform CRA_b [Rattus norvegicus]
MFHFACPVSLILSCQAVYFPTMKERGFSVCGDLRQGEHGRWHSSVSVGTLGLSCSDTTQNLLCSWFGISGRSTPIFFLGKPRWPARMEKPEGQGRRVTSSHGALSSGAPPVTLLSQG